jgi:hypothetical protein
MLLTAIHLLLVLMCVILFAETNDKAATARELEFLIALWKLGIVQILFSLRVADASVGFAVQLGSVPPDHVDVKPSQLTRQPIHACFGSILTLLVLLPLFLSVDLNILNLPLLTHLGIFDLI